MDHKFLPDTMFDTNESMFFVVDDGVANIPSSLSFDLGLIIGISSGSVGFPSRGYKRGYKVSNVSEY